MPLLDHIHIPADMKALTNAELVMLAEEVRQETIKVVSQTGGHLGASLGVVELTVALHAVFDAPWDKIIWDVGHQAYPHKILTGRRDKMPTLRQGGGLSGFTKRAESPYDPFGAGHSSTSISAALGMAVVRDLIAAQNPPPHTRENLGEHIIAVIGDGAMSAGMAYEALNNAGHLKSRLIIILNDNAMSIAKPTGALAKHLTKLVSSQGYRKTRDIAKRFLPPACRKAASMLESSARSALGHGTFFEAMGCYYIGPVNGHDISELLTILRNLRDSPPQGPVLLHVHTIKGKGYAPAETAPDAMHGVRCFEVETGQQVKGTKGYTHIFSQALIDHAHNDPKIVGITAAMPCGTGMREFGAVFPTRMFDVGIAEQHAVTFAAGVAARGFKPFVAIYSTFLQRAYDQIVHDVALQRLPVRFVLDRAGLVGSDGATHAGSFDIAFLGCLPNMVLMAPSDEAELIHMVATAVAYDDGPIVLRFPRGEGVGVPLQAPQLLTIGKGRVVRNGTNIAILSYGTRLAEALKAAEYLNATVADARFAKPLDEDLVRQLLSHHHTLITVEEGSRGGLGSMVLEYAAKTNLTKTHIIPLTLPDSFQDHDTPSKQYAAAGIIDSDILRAANWD